MLKNFTKYAGIVQTLIGLASQFIPSIGGMLGAQAAGGNIFNILSGAALSYLGFKGSDSAQRTGAQAIGGLNGLGRPFGFYQSRNAWRTWAALEFRSGIEYHQSAHRRLGTLCWFHEETGGRNCALSRPVEL